MKINDKHFEVVVRQMMRKMTVVDAGDTKFLEKQIVTKIEFMEEGDIIANYVENDSKRSFKLRVLFRDLSIEDRIKLSSSGITVHSLANDKPVVLNLSSDEINNQGLVELSNRIFLNLRK